MIASKMIDRGQVSRARRHLVGAALALAALAVAPSLANAQAQDYPNKPVKLVVPFAAGGGTDVLARIWSDAIGKRLNRRFLVENQPGANGALGTMAGIKARPDGYTLTMGVASTMAINPHMMKDIGYTANDLQPVAMVGFSPWLMVASSKLPFQNVGDVIAYGKANPGKLTFASWTATGEIGRKGFVLRSGVDLLSVPYAGSVAAMTDLVAGRASLALLDISAALPFIQSGDVRPLAMTSSQRTALLPNVPSISESGIQNYDVTSWVILFAPVGTPSDIVAKLNTETIAALGDAEVKKRFDELGAEILEWDVAKVKAFVVAQNEKWAAMVAETGSTPK
jgi:tripartite-type tricarboxylate transporter receptor subunit TctC